MEAIIRDIRIAGRTLGRTPGFTIAVTLILAVGIGATSVVFSLIDFAFLKPLPVNEPQELTALFNFNSDNGQYSSISFPDFLDYRERNRVFSDLVAYSSEEANLGGETGEATVVTTHLVTGEYFRVLGIEAFLGRLFQPDEVDLASVERVVVLSHSLWRQRFAEAPGLIGADIILNGHSYTVIGITPEGFRGPDLGSPPDLWAPLTPQSVLLPDYGRRLFFNRGTHWLIALGRLAPDVPLDLARTELLSLSRQQALSYPETNEGWSVVVQPAGRGIIWPGYKGLIVFLVTLLLCVVGLVLLLICFNISNLLMAKAAKRRREVSVRLALGASRNHLLRQLLAESMLLALMGGVAGTLLAYWAIDIIKATGIIGFIPGGFDLGLGPRVLGFILLLTALTALTFGLLPALRASRLEMVQNLKGEIQTTSNRIGRSGPRNVLVVVQVSIALVLLVMSGLFAKSLNRQLNVELGFDTSGLLLAPCDLETANYPDDAGVAFQNQLLSRVRATPGVVSASTTHIVPMGRRRMAMDVSIPDYESVSGEAINFEANAVGTDFFTTMGIPVTAGRQFSFQDDFGSSPVAIVSQSAVQRFWAGESPVGAQVYTQATGDRAVTVIGVARDVRHGRVVMGRTMIREATPTIYLPLLQNYQPRFTLIVKAAGDPGELVGSINTIFNELNRYLPVEVETYDSYVSSQLAGPSIVTSVLRISSLFALLLAALGLYGLVAFSVSRRTREFGVRIALGAQSRDVIGLVLRQGLVQVGWGIAIGLPVSLAINKVLASVLYGVGGFDIMVFGVFALLLAFTGVTASYLPAKRAASVNPVIALRAE